MVLTSETAEQAAVQNVSEFLLASEGWQSKGSGSVPRCVHTFVIIRRNTVNDRDFHSDQLVQKCPRVFRDCHWVLLL